MCLGFDTIHPPTDESKDQVFRVKVLMWVQLAIGIFILFVGTSNGIGMLFMVLPLCCAYNQLSLCGCIVFIFFTLFDLVSSINLFGTLIQDNIKVSTSKAKFQMGVLIFLFIYKIVAIYLIFVAYRVFRATWKEQGHERMHEQEAESQSSDDNDDHRYNQNRYSNQNNNQSYGRPYQPNPNPNPYPNQNQYRKIFIIISEAQPNPAIINQGNNSNSHPHSGRGFRQFEGRGIEIGSS